jgi:hypothetical protein
MSLSVVKSLKGLVAFAFAVPVRVADPTQYLGYLDVRRTVVTIAVYIRPSTMAYLLRSAKAIAFAVAVSPRTIGLIRQRRASPVTSEKPHTVIVIHVSFFPSPVPSP